PHRPLDRALPAVVDPVGRRAPLSVEREQLPAAPPRRIGVLGELGEAALEGRVGVDDRPVLLDAALALGLHHQREAVGTASGQKADQDPRQRRVAEERARRDAVDHEAAAVEVPAVLEAAYLNGW